MKVALSLASFPMLVLYKKSRGVAGFVRMLTSLLSSINVNMIQVNVHVSWCTNRMF